MSSAVISSLSVLLGLILVITAIGFRRMVCFLSIGYAFAIAAMALASAVIFRGYAPLLAVLQSATLLFWGLRFGVFVTHRELSPNYQKGARPH